MPQDKKPSWVNKLAEFNKADNRKAAWQLANTLIPYFALWAMMIFIVKQGWSYWTTLPLAILTGLLTVRLFIFFHDCCHESFFTSRTANRMVGYITGVLTFSPFEEWRRAHNVHHASAGDLDRRGTGDVWTMTVKEYKNAPRSTRLKYRIYRNPFVMFVLGPAFLFLVSMRFPQKDSGKKERRSVWITNLLLIMLVSVMGWALGFSDYLKIQLPILFVAGSVGIWLFYVQHQFEEVYWSHHENWDAVAAALKGSSYYKLPKVLQWLTGNIGLHHIHHLRPRIPNYHLQACYRAIPEMQQAPEITFVKSLKSMFLNLWDEETKRLISFRQYRLKTT